MTAQQGFQHQHTLTAMMYICTSCSLPSICIHHPRFQIKHHSNLKPQDIISATSHMDRQNPFHRQQLLSGNQTNFRQPVLPTPDRQPTNNPFNRQAPRTNYRPAYESEPTEDTQYSAAHHPYIELQHIDRRRSNDAQFTASPQPSPQRPTHSRQSTTIQNSTEQYYAGDQGYASPRQYTSTTKMGQQSSATRAPSCAPSQAPSRTEPHYTFSDQGIFEVERPPSSWKGPVIPRNKFPYPIPPMRKYQHFNDVFHKFIIQGSRPRLIERLNAAATVDAKERGYFSDTGLVSIDSIDRDFCAAEYILFYCDHLVEPIMHQRRQVFPSTFGVMGEDMRSGQWRVRCWTQPSERVSREIQLMVREKLVICDNIDKKHEPRGRGLDGRMSMQEHEMIWTLIQGWDREMRAKWSDSFQVEGGGPTKQRGEPTYPLVE